MGQENGNVALRMLRLQVLDHDDRPAISTNVFMDEGSNTSLMWQGFERALKLEN
ncbi:hypothetical protein DAPPUDRAFT_262328 [Daphnia pulex]|uniref:Uncharacterized protein n=1 Tax=Daphnia pulex TaxID=6669 RepID=E9HMR0_DAPPU|nr:hypothetical protein DAPPUDRAFT_262328 [Daphnia pulex]|eukprot:EFX66967.1 hypothetical protein DAPPUDRAFT_262328 [Daphnia pulex]